jgi:hypothetical protein
MSVIADLAPGGRRAEFGDGGPGLFRLGREYVIIQRFYEVT